MMDRIGSQLKKGATVEAGAAAPQDKRRDIDYQSVIGWLNSQSPRQLEIIYRRCGIVGRPQFVARAQKGISFS